MLSNFINTLVNFVAPTSASADVVDTVLQAVLDLPAPLPKGLEDLRTGAATLRAELPGCRIIAGLPEAFGPKGDLVVVKTWTSSRGGFTKGGTLFTKVTKGAWGYLACRPEKNGAARSGAEVLNLDPETLKPVGDRQFPSAEIRFKFSSMGQGANYQCAMADIAAWLSGGDGTRKDLILVAQLNGKVHEETKDGVPQGRYIQPVGGFVLLEIPRTNTREEGKVGDLPLGPTRTTLKAATAAATKPQVITVAADAAAVTPASAASADEL